MNNNQNNIYDQNFNNDINNIYQNNNNPNLNINSPAPKKKNKTVIIVVVVIIVFVLIGLVSFVLPLFGAAETTTDYLSNARKGAFADNALTAISSVRVDVVSNGLNDSCYNLDEINELVGKRFITSPFGSNYSNTSYIYVYDQNTYSMCLVDEDGNGFEYMSESEISKDKVHSNVECTLPLECR